jgi:hypothetical protein
MSKNTPRLLLALATLSILVLLLVSDFAPKGAQDFEAASSQTGETKVICTVQSSKDGTNGWTLRLTDGQMNTVGAFLSHGSGPPPSVGAIIEATGTFSDSRDFFFIRGFETIRDPR